MAAYLWHKWKEQAPLNLPHCVLFFDREVFQLSLEEEKR